MKKTILSALICCLGGVASAQNPITDTVSTGPQYGNQVWYSLNSGNKTNIVKSDWDIAFRTLGFSVSILINDGGGIQLWKYPNGDIDAWNSIDTLGMDSWVESFNSETDWEEGAFNKYPAGNTDYGWGNYDQVTHIVSGNAVFIMKLSDGSFKKMVIESLQTDGTYTFKYADLDGSNEENISLLKSDYGDKNFAYYSLQSNQALDLEPNSSDWDLLFTQYTDFISAGTEIMPYKVTGVLTNIGTSTAKAEGVDASIYTDYGNHTFESDKNIIGYDWKSFDMNNNVYEVEDSTIYFINDKNDDIWKVVFTGFGGSGNGDFIFNKEKLTTTSIHDATGLITSMAVYPNPVLHSDLNVAYNLKENNTEISISVFDHLGRMTFQEKTHATSGMNVKRITTDSWTKGMYILVMEVNGEKTTRKITIL